ncbi:MAG: hypothetical protein HY882_13345 [Deltaproteobacteria bacterium]|nr:hypothetical protein [Deltaproteobacteria bacterium]
MSSDPKPWESHKYLNGCGTGNVNPTGRLLASQSLQLPGRACRARISGKNSEIFKKIDVFLTFFKFFAGFDTNIISPSEKRIFKITIAVKSMDFIRQTPADWVPTSSCY